MLQKSNHYHCVSKAHEKNASQITGMAWSDIAGSSGGDLCWRLGRTSAEGASVERRRREDRGTEGARRYD